MTGFFSKVQEDLGVPSIKNKALSLRPSGLDNYFISGQNDNSGQKPTLPSINHLLKGNSYPLPLREFPEENSFVWGTLRTSQRSTIFHSPLSSYTRPSPINLPSIRNNLKCDVAPRQQWPQIQYLPNSQTTCLLAESKRGTTFSPSVNEEMTCALPDSNPTSPDSQIKRRGKYNNNGITQEIYNQETQKEYPENNLPSTNVCREFSSINLLPTPPEITLSLERQQYPQQIHQQEVQQLQQQMIPINQMQSSDPLRSPLPIQYSRTGIEEHSGNSQSDSSIPTLPGSTGPISNNGICNQRYGLGIYPVAQDGNVIPSGVIHNGMIMNDLNGNNNDYRVQRYGQTYSRYCGDYQNISNISSSTYQLQPIITASRDIKRRTKTGCMTCRRRRIKCDERHPTCLNCEKSKRVCVGYDPVFRNQIDKRRRKIGASWNKDKNYGCNKTFTLLQSNLQNTRPPSNTLGNTFKYESSGGGNQVNSSPDASGTNGYRSPLAGEVSSTVSCSNTPVTVTSASSSPPSPPSEISDKEKNRCRIKIASLLDAAVVIESLQDKNSNGSDSKSSSLNSGPIPSSSKDLESVPCFQNPPAWNDVCGYFAENIAVHLDDMFNTRRFSEIATDCNRKTLTSMQHGKARGSEDLAVMETIRQIFSILHPSVYVENLALDENSKLEELRITGNYKLMRCILQLISSDRDTEFLPVAVEDNEIFLKISALHQFIYGGVVQRLNQDGSQSLTSPVSPQNESRFRFRRIPKIDEGISREEVWKLLQFIRDGGSLYEDDIELMAVVCQSNINKTHSSLCAISVAVLLGLHFSLSNLNTSKTESRIRIRLLEMSGSGAISEFLRRLIDMTLSL